MGRQREISSVRGSSMSCPYCGSDNTARLGWYNSTIPIPSEVRVCFSCGRIFKG